MKFLCVCGNVIRDQLIPNPIGMLVIPETVLDELSEGNTVPLDGLWRHSALALQCEICGRLWVRWKRDQPSREEFVPVKPDGTIPGYVLIEPPEKKNPGR